MDKKWDGIDRRTHDESPPDGKEKRKNSEFDFGRTCFTCEFFDMQESYPVEGGCSVLPGTTCSPVKFNRRHCKEYRRLADTTPEMVWRTKTLDIFSRKMYDKKESASEKMSNETNRSRGRHPGDVCSDHKPGQIGPVSPMLEVGLHR